MGPGRLAAVRLSFATYVYVVIATMVTTVEQHHTATGPALSGLAIFATFTVWCWTIIGIYFTLAGIISALDVAGLEGTSRAALFSARVAWVLFQVMFSCAVLVFLAVWFVLLPSAYLTEGSDGGLLHFAPLSMHNLNVVFMSVEMCVNRLAFVPAHALFAMYYGVAYVVFSWCWFFYAGNFFYFFIDWRHPVVFLGYTALIAVLWGAFAGGGRMTSWAKRASLAELPLRSGQAVAVEVTSREPPSAA